MKKQYILTQDNYNVIKNAINLINKEVKKDIIQKRKPLMNNLELDTLNRAISDKE